MGTGVAVPGSFSAGDGVYRSRDAGRTWTHLGASVFAGIRSPSEGDAGSHITGLAVQPGNSRVVLAAVLNDKFATQPSTPNSGIYRSADGGET